MNEKILESLIQRLDRLEREARRWRVLGGIGGVALVILGLVTFNAWAQAAVQEEIRARQIVLVDRKQWKDRIVLTTETDGSPVLRLVGSDAQAHASLGLDAENAPHLALAGTGSTVALGADGLQISWQAERAALTTKGLALEGAGAPSPSATYRATGLRLQGAEGSVALGVEGDGPRMEIRDPAAKPKVTLAVGLDGDLGLSFYEKDGRLRATLGHLILPPSPGQRAGDRRVGLFLAWFDANGKVVWKAP